MMSKNSNIFTLEQVAQHKTESDAWIIVKDKVFDVTQFLNDHPGGKKVLVRVLGSDATKQFNQFHNQAILDKYIPSLCIGSIGSGSGSDSGTVAKKSVDTGLPPMFGDMVPFGDPEWYQGLNSPYYSESHRKLRVWMRDFVSKELDPFAHDWDESGQPVPHSVFRKCGETGILAAVCGPPWSSEYLPNISPPGGVKPEEFDCFHEFIVMDELARVGSGGVLWGLMGGHTIALPPVIHFASDYIKNKVVPDCLSGKKVVCLAVTEPSGGSDVANLKTIAKKTADGKHYIVWWDHSRIGGHGMSGISLLLLEKGMPGIITRKMKCSGVWSSGTTYMAFEDVKVPVENLIGVENQGFRSVMANFNHERMGIAIQANRFARVCLEEALKYAQKRETFGVKMIEHGVIRNKLANMARKVEATHAWIESLLYQIKTLPKVYTTARLGGPIALLKAQSTQTFEYCARESAQIFGGLSFTRGGQAEKVERLNREVRAYAVPGGSEEIMLDLGVRQSLRVFATLKNHL